MRITIKNFRIYKDKVSFDFPDNKITLLSGKSGSGKSTLFIALEYLLYGKIQQIYPKDHKPSAENNTVVTLKLGKLKIKRSKPPDVLEVTTPEGNVLIDNEADAFIYQFFGSRDLWCSSSYAVQEEKNPLLQLTNAKKFQLLKEMVFGVKSDDPNEKTVDFYEEKIELELSVIKKKILKETSEMNGFFDSYNQQLSANQKALKKWGSREKTKEEIKKLKVTLEENNLLLEKLNKKYLESKHIESSNKTILENIENLENTISDIQIVSTEKLEKDISLIENNIEKLGSYLENLQEYEKLKEELDNIFYLKEHNDIEDINKEILILSGLKGAYDNLNKICPEEIMRKFVENPNDGQTMTRSYKSKPRVIKTKEEYNTISEYLQEGIKKYNNYLTEYEEVTKSNTETENLLLIRYQKDCLELNSLKLIENEKIQNNSLLKREYEDNLNKYSKFKTLKEEYENLFFIEDHEKLNEKEIEKEINKLMRIRSNYELINSSLNENTLKNIETNENNTLNNTLDNTLKNKETPENTLKNIEMTENTLKNIETNENTLINIEENTLKNKKENTLKTIETVEEFMTYKNNYLKDLEMYNKIKQEITTIKEEYELVYKNKKLLLENNIKITNDDKVYNKQLKEIYDMNLNNYNKYISLTEELSNLFFIEDHEILTSEEISKEINKLNVIKEYYNTFNCKTLKEFLEYKDSYLSSLNVYNKTKKEISNIKESYELEYKNKKFLLEDNKKTRKDNLVYNKQLKEIYELNLNNYNKYVSLNKEFSNLFFIEDHEIMSNEEMIKEINKLNIIKEYYNNFNCKTVKEFLEYKNVYQNELEMYNKTKQTITNIKESYEIEYKNKKLLLENNKKITKDNKIYNKQLKEIYEMNLNNYNRYISLSLKIKSLIYFSKHDELKTKKEVTKEKNRIDLLIDKYEKVNEFLTYFNNFLEKEGIEKVKKEENIETYKNYNSFVNNIFEFYNLLKINTEKYNTTLANNTLLENKSLEEFNIASKLYERFLVYKQLFDSYKEKINKYESKISVFKRELKELIEWCKENYDPDFDSDKINIYKNNIDLTLKELICPCCHKGLILSKNGKLTKGTTSSEDKLNLENILLKIDEISIVLIDITKNEKLLNDIVSDKLLNPKIFDSSLLENIKDFCENNSKYNYTILKIKECIISDNFNTRSIETIVYINPILEDLQEEFTFDFFALNITCNLNKWSNFKVEDQLKDNIQENKNDLLLELESLNNKDTYEMLNLELSELSSEKNIEPEIPIYKDINELEEDELLYSPPSCKDLEKILIYPLGSDPSIIEINIDLKTVEENLLSLNNKNKRDSIKSQISELSPEKNIEPNLPDYRNIPELEEEELIYSPPSCKDLEKILILPEGSDPSNIELNIDLNDVEKNLLSLNNKNKRDSIKSQISNLSNNEPEIPIYRTINIPEKLIYSPPSYEDLEKILIYPSGIDPSTIVINMNLKDVHDNLLSLNNKPKRDIIKSQIQLNINKPLPPDYNLIDEVIISKILNYETYINESKELNKYPEEVLKPSYEISENFVKKIKKNCEDINVEILSLSNKKEYYRVKKLVVVSDD